MIRPHAPSGDVCPFHRKDVSKVCHTCPLYVLIKGKDPQSEKELEHWGCSFAWGPVLTIEAAQSVRQGTASTDAFRKEFQSISGIQMKQSQMLLHMMNDGIQRAQLERFDENNNYKG